MSGKEAWLSIPLSWVECLFKDDWSDMDCGAIGGGIGGGMC
jgi:hypothetical protein